MGYFEDYKDGLTTPEPEEHGAMDAEGFDPDCSEDRALWRIDNAYGNVYKWDGGADAYVFYCKLRNWEGADSEEN